LLRYFREAGIPVVGIEPAANIAKIAREQRGIPTITEFFGRELAERLAGEGRQADVIHANNVLAHAGELGSFLDGLRELLKPEGAAVIEVPYVKDMIERVEFDTIYHEHLSYFSLTSLDSLCVSRGLLISETEHLEMHGGSLRVWIEHAGIRSCSDSVSELLAKEKEWGVNRLSFYQNFSVAVERLKTRLLRLLLDLKSQGARIAAYGSSAKGSTLLNCFGIDRRTLDFVVDRSTEKQGLFTPGTHLPICAPEKLLESRPEFTLLLTWNFADEILKQQAEYCNRGGKFIVPIPEPRVV
jgi:hypothetical protein